MEVLAKHEGFRNNIIGGNAFANYIQKIKVENILVAISSNWYYFSQVRAPIIQALMDMLDAFKLEPSERHTIITNYFNKTAYLSQLRITLTSIFTRNHIPEIHNTIDFNF